MQEHFDFLIQFFSQPVRGYVQEPFFDDDFVATAVPVRERRNPNPPGRGTPRKEAASVLNDTDEAFQRGTLLISLLEQSSHDLELTLEIAKVRWYFFRLLRTICSQSCKDIHAEIQKDIELVSTIFRDEASQANALGRLLEANDFLNSALSQYTASLSRQQHGAAVAEEPTAATKISEEGVRYVAGQDPASAGNADSGWEEVVLQGDEWATETKEGNPVPKKNTKEPAKIVDERKEEEIDKMFGL